MMGLRRFQNEGSRESLDRFDGMAELVSVVSGATVLRYVETVLGSIQ